MELLNKIENLDKIPVRIVILIWLVSVLILVLPESMLILLSLSEFKLIYGKYIGIIFLTSSGLLITAIVSFLYKSIRRSLNNKKTKRIALEAIRTLDDHEKAVIREFVIQGRNTLRLPVDNPTVNGLINKRLLHQVGSLGQMSIVGLLVNISLTELADSNLTSEILGLPESEPSKTERESIMNDRPSFIKRLEERRFLW